MPLLAHQSLDCRLQLMSTDREASPGQHSVRDFTVRVPNGIAACVLEDWKVTEQVSRYYRRETSAFA